MRRLAALMLAVGLLSGCGNGAAPVETAPSPTPAAVTAELLPSPTPAPDPVGERVSRMTTEELAGQLLVVGIERTTPGEDARQAIEELHVGGIILFGRNVESAEQLAELTNGLKETNKAAGNVPVFLCVDEEGGLVSRMPPEVADLPSAYEYKGGGEQRGRILAEECKAFGFHVDFAPVLDVWSNPDNRVIGKRAFDSDHLAVTIAGCQCAYSMMDGGVIPVVKHFPGHGDTATDSHVGLPVVDKTREELERNELVPFQYAVAGSQWEGPDHAPVPAVMVGHILMTQMDPLLPASLSPAVVTDLLRGDMGFEGVVFTDDLTMGAVADTYGMGEAAVKAIQAGCDMALVCHSLDNVKAAYHGLLFAVEDGTLSRERLEESVRRVLALKEAYGVEDEPVGTPDVDGLNEMILAVRP